MRAASSVDVVRLAPRRRCTPICASSARIVRTSFSCGTLVSVSGSAVSSAAHRIGSAAFLAPETRTSPSSAAPAFDDELIHAIEPASAAAPPTLRASGSSSTARGSPRACGRRAPRRRAGGAATRDRPAKRRRHDQRLEVLAVAGDLDVRRRRGRLRCDALMDSGVTMADSPSVQCRSFQPRASMQQRRARRARRQRRRRARGSIAGATSDRPKKP